MILFTDGCHKIYYCATSDFETLVEMVGFGYDPIPGDLTTMQDMWSDSCGLRFISPANLDDAAPAIYQFDERDDITDFYERVVDFLATK